MLAHICFHAKHFFLCSCQATRLHMCCISFSLFCYSQSSTQNCILLYYLGEYFKIRIQEHIGKKKDTSHTGILSTPISESPLQRQSMITVSMCFRCCCCCWFVCLSVVRKIEFKYLRLHINGKKFCWFNPRQQFGWHTKKREEEMKNAWLTSTHVWIARQINQPNEKFVDNIYDFIGSDVTLFFFVTPGEWLLNGS